MRLRSPRIIKPYDYVLKFDFVCVNFGETDTTIIGSSLFNDSSRLKWHLCH